MPTMKFTRSQFAFCKHAGRSFVAILCALMLVPGEAGWAAGQSQDQAANTTATLPADQLDALVAPIALYPDPLLSQALVASTYPLEIIQLQQWLENNKSLQGKALADAAMKQNWDPSIQAMAVLPDMVKELAGNIKWTTDLGNAFLAQQSDVMDAVQRMRAKAQQKGNLKSSQQQTVDTQVVENKQVIVIQPANPEVIYVPSYNPTVVYGAPVYPYPPIAYPPAGYYAAGMALSFGVGMAVGAAWHGGYGWGCGWGGNNNVTINNNNNFINNSNRQNFQGGNRNQVNPQGKSSWQHNPQHRGGTPYPNRPTANKYGGTTRGDSLQNRQNNARNTQTRQNMGSNRGNAPSAGTMDRGGANRGTAGAGGNYAGNRGGTPSAGTMNRGGASGSMAGAGGGDRVGNRSVSSSPGSGGSSVFGGGSGSSARSSSSRGSSSFGGGGRSSGFGGGGGGGRSGGFSGGGRSGGRGGRR
jgi:hypothetical protein